MPQPSSVLFHGDHLVGFEDERGVFVALKPITEALNLNWSAQHARVRRDPILSEGMVIMVRPTAGGPQEMLCLPLDLLNGWLFTIDESRAKNPGTREKVLTYKRECYRVLFERFMRPQPPVTQQADQAPVSDAMLKRLRLVTECRQSHGIRAAQEMWRKLDLPMVPAMGAQPAQSAMPFTFDGQGGK